MGHQSGSESVTSSSVERFVDVARRRGVGIPGLFGVFYYRSANGKTLDALRQFLPVPVDGLTRDFQSGANAEDVCAQTIRALMSVGVRHFYVSNLPIARASAVLPSILQRADLSVGA